MAIIHVGGQEIVPQWPPSKCMTEVKPAGDKSLHTQLQVCKLEDRDWG